VRSTAISNLPIRKGCRSPVRDLCVDELAGECPQLGVEPVAYEPLQLGAAVGNRLLDGAL
jgi:hypothetical protein